MRMAAVLRMLGLAAALATPAAAAEFKTGAGVPPKGPLNTLVDVQRAVLACWKFPPESEVHGGLELRFILSFKRNGEIFGGRLTYQDRNFSPEERALYNAALMDAIKLCSPLPITLSLGEAIAGRPFVFTIRDTRKERKV
jgi:hypothetical protein